MKDINTLSAHYQVGVALSRPESMAYLAASVMEVLTCHDIDSPLSAMEVHERLALAQQMLGLAKIADTVLDNKEDDELPQTLVVIEVKECRYTLPSSMRKLAAKYLSNSKELAEAMDGFHTGCMAQSSPPCDISITSREFNVE